MIENTSLQFLSTRSAANRSELNGAEMKEWALLVRRRSALARWPPRSTRLLQAVMSLQLAAIMSLAVRAEVSIRHRADTSPHRSLPGRPNSTKFQTDNCRRVISTNLSEIFTQHTGDRLLSTSRVELHSRITWMMATSDWSISIL